jgi:hypothetical protein
MVIGGMATQFLGHARMTRDLDLMVGLGPGDAGKVVRALRPAFRPVPPDPPGFALAKEFLPFDARDGTRVDVLFAVTRYHLSAVRRATRLTVEGIRARVISPPDFIVFKLLAGRDLDLGDVRAVLKARGPRLDRKGIDTLVRIVAEDAGQPGLVDPWFGLLRGNGPSGQ